MRNGLGMSQEALAARLQIATPNVSKLERNEVRETISLGKLAEVARALDCQLVYAFVPNSSLEDTVQRQAEHVAASTLGYVSTTMGLEDQSIDPERLGELIAAEARRVIEANRQWSSR